MEFWVSWKEIGFSGCCLVLKVSQFLSINSNNSSRKMFVLIRLPKDTAEVFLNWMKNSAKMEEEV